MAQSRHSMKFSWMHEPSQKARCWFQLCSHLTRVVTAKSVNNFSHLWKKLVKMVFQCMYALLPADLCLCINKSSLPLRILVSDAAKNVLSGIPHPAFTGKIYRFFLMTLSLSFNSCPIPGDSLNFGSIQRATANLWNRHEKPDFRDSASLAVWPRYLTGRPKQS